MTPLEDTIRRAFRARASEIQPPVPPLDLRPRRASGSHGRLVFGPWQSTQVRWLGPAAAVITVLALVATALLWRGADQRWATGPAATIETSVPAYYVALQGDPQPQVNNFPASSSDAVAMRTVATVRVTATAAEVARVAPPAPYITFERVSGATDDRTFMLLAAGAADRSGLRAERFYLLHIDPQAASAADRTKLTALPAADIPAGRQVREMTLSPNGANLAAILNGGSADYLYVYNLQTQSTRVWTKTYCSSPSHCFAGPLSPMPSIFIHSSPSTGSGYAPDLSWTLGSRSLAFIPGGGGMGDSRLRLLHISRPGSNVESASTAVLSRRIAGGYWNWAVLTPDGTTVFIGYTQNRGGTLWYGLARFSLVTGKYTVIYKLLASSRGQFSVSPHPAGEGIDEVVWTSYDGSQAVVLDLAAGQRAGIYAGRRYTPLPWPRDVVSAAW